jgi:hypothetical protein
MFANLSACTALATLLASRRMRLPRLLLPSAFGLALACGSAPPPPSEVGTSRPAPRERAKAPGVPALDAALVARVPRGTFGPYVGHDAEQALLVWAAEDPPGTRSWRALAVDRRGQARGEAARIGAAPAEIGVVAVRSLADGSFAVVSTRRGASAEEIEIMVLGADGKLLGAPRRVASSSTPVLWVDAMRVGQRRLLLWAVQSAGGADVYAVAVSERGEPAGEVRKPAAGVRAWQALPFGDGLALGVVRAGRDALQSGPVEVMWLGPDAQFAHSPTTLSADGSAELDLDLAVLGERLIVLWTDHRSGESRLMSAALARDGSLVVPAGPFTRPLGEQALLRVVSAGGGQRGYAVWENVAAPDGAGRSFEVARFGADARASGDSASILYASYDGSVPEVALSRDGLALLTLAPACPRGERCDDADALPSFLELDEKLEPRAFEPVRLNALGGDAPDLGWGLTCLAERCFLLSAQNEAPARVYWTTLVSKSRTFQVPVSKSSASPPPRVVETEVLAVGQPLAALALASVGERPLLVTLTDFDPTTPWVRLKAPAADGRYDPLRAALVLSTLGERAAVPPLSLRAHSLAGLGLAPGAKADEVVLGWAGLDAGQPQVFLTRLGPGGVKRDQKMLTHKKGGVSDVGLVPLADGYLVGWLDERSGAPELMTAKVNQALVRVGNEQRLGRREANPSELVLAAAGAGALAVWSDPGADNRGDLYGLRLSAKDGSAQGSELRLSETVQHSFSPALCARGAEVVLAWLERADAGDSEHSVMLGVLDANGAWKEAPERVAVAQGAPAALGLDCSAAATRVAVVVESSERWELVVFERVAGRSSEPKSVLRLAAGTRGLRPVLRGDDIFLAEAAPGGQERVRRLKLVWK